MSRIRCRNTKPEMVLRGMLAREKVRGYKMHYKLPGNPDIVFVRKKLAVFVDGCFWHKCPRCFSKPATRTAFWIKKINGNVLRDRKINRTLKKEGWKVLRVWEHETRKNHGRVVSKIRKYLG